MNAIPVRRRSTLTCALTLAALAVLVPANPAQAAVGCEVTYTSSSWSTGFVGNAQIRNLGDTWTAPTVQLTFTGNQQITSGWGYELSQSGTQVTARSMTWSRPIATGETLAFGFGGSYTGINLPPTDWRVNGVPCVLTGQPPAVIAEPTSLSVPEGHGVSFSIRLSHPPAQATSLRMTTRGTGIWASPPVLLTFNSTNWSTPQSFSVYSAQDQDTVDDVVVFTLAYPGYVSDTVTVTQVDDD
ncbi:cellulose binding domain-containing protein [Plantactinospora sp. S1510]|uniref:Cellulose binding domain-containing protein n=1 Tax=Plantactinospora alkalitolerans TaxID=2789879 RepID=A0ABS0GT84_9ACTN|nr:cellulose binding domain-containing protein [Plantactinospora alkalitolerans]MBF9129411.1 cellulose binding domain-containing protein [Plantactinospora alkalitolerans]